MTLTTGGLGAVTDKPGLARSPVEFAQILMSRGLWRGLSA